MEEDDSEGAVAEGITRVQRFGIGKIILILLILFFAFWFFFARVPSSVVTLSFVEKDSSIEISGVSIEASQDGVPAKACELPFLLCKDASSFAASGSRVSMFLPGGQVQLSLLPPPKYAQKTLVVNVQGSQSQTVELERKSGASLSGPQAVSVGVGCSVTAPFLLKNKGKDSFSGDFVVEPAEAAALLPSLALVHASVQGDGEQSIPLEVRGAQAKGKTDVSLRVKGTGVSAKFSIATLERAALSISPSDASCSQYPCSITISVRNSGAVRAEGLKVSFSQELAEAASVIALDTTSIEPGEELKFAVQIMEPETAYGKIILSTQCPPRSEIGVSFQHSSG